MRIVHALALVILGCNSSSPTPDASVDAATCPGSQFYCYTNCTDLTPSSAAACMASGWQCPATDCACSAQGTAAIVCFNCVDGAAPGYQECDASSGHYDCPAGTSLGTCPSGDAGVDSGNDAASDAAADAPEGG
jgi:hypothetical protein